MRRLVPLFLLNLIIGTMEFLIPIKFSGAHIGIVLTAVIFSAGSFCSLVLDIPSGKLSDRIGRERLIGAFMLMVTVAALLLYFSHSVVLFFLAEIILGLSYGVCWSPLLAMIGDGSDGHEAGTAYARFFRIAALGEGVAPLIVALLIVREGINFPFLMVVAIALACFVIIMLQPHEPMIPSTPQAEKTSYGSALKLVQRSLPLNVFLMATAFFVAFFWESVWFSQPLIGFYGNSILDSALIVAAFSIPNVLFSDFLGILIRRFEERTVYLYSAALAVISFLAFYVSTGLGAKLIFIFLAAIGVLGIWLVMDVLSSRLHASGEKGEFFGAIETMRDISYFIAPLFIAATYRFIGLDGIFAVNAVGALLLLCWGIFALSGTYQRHQVVRTL